jgi:hypothetical protein
VIQIAEERGERGHNGGEIEEIHGVDFPFGLS